MRQRQPGPQRSDIAYAAGYLDQGSVELRAGLGITRKELRDARPQDPSVLAG